LEKDSTVHFTVQFEKKIVNLSSINAHMAPLSSGAHPDSFN